MICYLRHAGHMECRDKGKGHLVTGYEGTEEGRSIVLLFLGVVGGPLAALHTGKTPYLMYTTLGGSQGRFGRLRKISPPSRLDPRTVQPVANRYAD